MNCPVCSRPFTGQQCPVCGYDRSRDYGDFPTLAPLTGDFPTTARRRNERAGLLLCSKCGSPDFHFRFADRNFSCPRCGHLLTPQELDTILAIMGCAPLHHSPAPPPPSKRRITAVSAGFDHTVVLYSDGTVGAVGSNYRGQCNVGGWTDITAIAAGACITVGLRRDGTLVAAGDDRNYRGCTTWAGITAIDAWQHTLGLTKTGTVRAAGSDKAGQCRTDHWRDITAIAVGGMHSVGLKKDGTVVTAGYSGEGLADAHRWSDITAIAAGAYITVGLRRNGTVTAVGHSSPVPEEVKRWYGITAITAANGMCIGLRSNGTALTAGDCAFDLSHWTNLRTVSANFRHAVGLRTDGTLLAAGNNDNGQCDVQRLMP